MKSLVTGGAGFIGAHIVRELLELGHEVVVLDDLSGGFEDNIPPQAAFVHGTILDHELIDRLFAEHKFDYVYHLAAYAAEGLSHFIKRFNYNNNLIGSVNLINASVNHNVKCFVFTSSIAVYGAGQLPMKEEYVPQPEDPYGIAKYAVEQELKVSHEMFGLDYVVFRPHNVYGEFQNIGDKYRNVIGIFMNQIMSGQPLSVFGDGMQTRAFSYIKEISPIISRAPENREAYGQVFNVGADRPYSIIELAEEIGKFFGTKPQINHLPARNEVQHAYSSHEKVRQYFGPAKEYSLQEGIVRMGEWAKEHGPRKSKEFGEIEIMKNMPKGWVVSKA